MGYRSKTYSLSEEVIAAIEAAKAGGTSPNRFLRQLLGLDGEPEVAEHEVPAVVNEAPAGSSFEGRKFYRRDR